MRLVDGVRYAAYELAPTTTPSTNTIARAQASRLRHRPVRDRDIAKRLSQRVVCFLVRLSSYAYALRGASWHGQYYGSSVTGRHWHSLPLQCTQAAGNHWHRESWAAPGQLANVQSCICAGSCNCNRERQVSTQRLRPQCVLRACRESDAAAAAQSVCVLPARRGAHMYRGIPAGRSSSIAMMALMHCNCNCSDARLQWPRGHCGAACSAGTAAARCSSLQADRHRRSSWSMAMDDGAVAAAHGRDGTRVVHS